MSITDVFSKRQKKLRGRLSDVYTYDKLPQPLRVQIILILRETLGDEDDYDGDRRSEIQRAYHAIVQTLCREYGVFYLFGTSNPTARVQLEHYLLHEEQAEKVLDAIELSFKCIDHMTRDYDYLYRDDAPERADAAIEELNARFREHGVGYQFAEGEIIRVDSELLHAEVVKPALALLRTKKYAGAQQEFLKAYEHYRHGRTKEALAECLKALESVMKSICAKRRWKHDPSATSKHLIQTLFDKGLIPSFWQQHFAALRSTLESGVPTARNKLGGHGQGTEIREVPMHLVAYVLHLTAAAIVFLIEAEQNLP